MSFLRFCQSSRNRFDRTGAEEKRKKSMLFSLYKLSDWVIKVRNLRQLIGDTGFIVIILCYSTVSYTISIDLTTWWMMLHKDECMKAE